MLNSLAFWVLIAGLIAFVAKFFVPSIPFDAEQILAVLLFVLGLFGFYPKVFLAPPSHSLTVVDLFHSLAFWVMVVGLVEFVVHYYFPDFPLEQANLLALVLFVLYQFGITPELRARGLLK